MMYEDEKFFELIINKQISQYITAVIGETAILHLQNGIILFPSKKHNQSRFHKDFPKDFQSSKLLSLNAFVLIDDFDEMTGEPGWCQEATNLKKCLVMDSLKNIRYK